jgi:hypothetical protein
VWEANELRTAQVRQLFSQSQAGLIGALLSTLVIAVALRDQVNHLCLGIWLGTYLAVHVPRYLLVPAFHMHFQELGRE